MKPLYLKITAFGPYANTTELNFKEDLKNQNIFVVTGPTGSGKTTIFDAMCYALYGQTSGNKRSAEQLRSDFLSDDSDMTEIEFSFSVRDKVYSIKRSPKQKRKSKRGSGLVEVQATVEFKDISEDSKPLTKEKDVSDAVLDVIGLNVDQFRKIVMIPQGDFREFLYANTSVKEEILRKIFGTDIYKKVQEQLKIETNLLENEVKDIDREIKANLKVVKCDENSTLDNLIKNDALTTQIVEELDSNIKSKKEELKKESLELENIIKAINTLQKSINEAKLINEKFNQRDLEVAKLNSLSSRKDEFVNKENTLNYSKKALDILIHEENLEKEKVESSNIKRDILTSVEIKDSYNKRMSDTKQKFDNIINIEKLKEERIVKLTELNNYEKYVLTIEDKKKLISHLSTELTKIEDNKKLLKEESEKLLQDIDKHLKLQGELYSIEKEKIELVNKVSYYNELLPELRVFCERCKELNNTTIAIKQFKEKEDLLSKEINDLKKDYNSKEDIFINGEAIRLAKGLREGCACPVCGSKEHPHPKVTNENIPTKDDLDKIKKYIDTKEQDKNKISQELVKCESIINNSKSYIDSYTEKFLSKGIFKPEEDLLDYKNIVVPKGTYIKEELSKLEQRNKVICDTINNINKEIEVINKKKERKVIIEKELENIDLKHKKTSEQLISQNNSLNEVNKIVPIKYQNINELREDIKNCNNEISLYEKEISKIRLDYDTLSKEIVAINSKIENLNLNLERSSNKLSEQKHKFEALVNASFENLEEYNKYKLKVHLIDNLQVEIDNYKSDMNLLIKTIELLDEQLKDLQVIDIEQIDKKLNERVVIKEEIDSNINMLNLTIKHNSDICKSIKSKYESIKEKEKRYKTVATLSKLANGNTYNKVSFETFVLSTYFEEVILQANKRLEKMTAKRYYLLRREENKGGGRKGLDLDVYDSHTSKSRPVNTLSGGESFKASLALALGLSDTVQFTAGGVWLDTMFIDEGFGTLDIESLDNAIDTLMELQDSGRLIGIISHVNELKERIPAKLIVESHTRGSKAYFKV